MENQLQQVWNGTCISKHDTRFESVLFSMFARTPYTGENDPMGSSLKKITKWVRKLCLWVRTFIFLHFAPIRSVVQNPHCHFSMDESIGSFSPVQGERIYKLILLFAYGQ